MPSQPTTFLQAFRQAGPYINAHRGKTFVVLFSGTAVDAPDFAQHIHDVALLHALGVHIVLVHGARPQIEARFHEAGRPLRYAKGLRITEAQDIPLVKQAIGRARIRIEAQLSMSTVHSPMQGAQLRILSGNVVTARPVGVRDGIDYGLTGEVRKIDASTIQWWLDHGAIALLSPLGYSPTGEVFNLSAEEVAVEAAIALCAEKILILSEGPALSDADGQMIREVALSEVETLLLQPELPEETARHLRLALRACQQGVRRVHRLGRAMEGALLLELFTRDGVGTLVSADQYEGIRPATIDDVGGILALIRPLEADGTLVFRSRERLEMEIARFTLIERDGTMIGCAALYPFLEEQCAELACVAVHPAYRNHARAEALLHFIEKQAIAEGVRRLFVLTTRTAHWFVEHGFVPAGVTDLPVQKRALYNWQRRSKVFVKPLED